jgi:hypothetical protein
MARIRYVAYDLGEYTEMQLADPYVAETVLRGGAFPHQEKISKMITQQLKDGGEGVQASPHGHALVLPCGTGKTGILSLILKHVTIQIPHFKVAVVAPGHLCPQLAHLLASSFERQRFSNANSNVNGRSHGCKFLIETDKFLLAVVTCGKKRRLDGSAVESGPAGSVTWLKELQGESEIPLVPVLSKDLPGILGLTSGFDLILCDEAHLYPTLVKQLLSSKKHRVVLATATPSNALMTKIGFVYRLTLTSNLRRLLGMPMVEIVENRLQGIDIALYWKNLLLMLAGVSRLGGYEAAVMTVGRLILRHHSSFGEDEYEGVLTDCRLRVATRSFSMMQQYVLGEEQDFRFACAALAVVYKPLIDWVTKEFAVSLADPVLDIMSSIDRDKRLVSLIHEFRPHVHRQHCCTNMRSGLELDHNNLLREMKIEESWQDSVLSLKPSLGICLVKLKEMKDIEGAVRDLRSKMKDDVVTVISSSQGRNRCNKLRQTMDQMGDKRMIIATLLRMSKGSGQATKYRAQLRDIMKIGGGKIANLIFQLAAPRIVVLADRSLEVGYNAHGWCTSLLLISLPKTVPHLEQQIGRMRRIGTDASATIQCLISIHPGTLQHLSYTLLKNEYEESE